VATYDYDLFVIGAGSGGVRAARIASQHGARVAICEEYRVGGTCVIRGCVPKKLLVYASHFAEDFDDAVGYGWDAPATKFDWAKLIANKDAEIERLSQIYIKNLKAAGVELLLSRGVLQDPHTIDLGDKTVTADKILVAVGGRPVLPDVPGMEHAITSNECFHLDALPGRVAVVGAGYIACEFAGIFNGLGSKVTLLYRGDQILRGFDQECRDFLAGEMQKKGIDIRLHADVAKLEKAKGGITVTLKDGATFEADTVLYATGREPNTADLGLEAAGVKRRKNGAVIVDQDLRTSRDNIFAIGDCTHRINLTPVAIKEGHIFADTQFGKTPRVMEYDNIAHAVFTQPSLSCVGLSEEAAREMYFDVKVFKTSFRTLKNTLSGNQERVFMKLVVHEATDKIVGIHMIGGDAPEIIQSLAVAIKCGATKAQFDATIAVHPTAAEEFVTMR
jgi:glutathione reductase (NADPH)